jgi:hypothetical protein
MEASSSTPSSRSCSIPSPPPADVSRETSTFVSAADASRTSTSFVSATSSVSARVAAATLVLLIAPRLLGAPMSTGSPEAPSLCPASDDPWGEGRASGPSDVRSTIAGRSEELDRSSTWEGSDTTAPANPTVGSWGAGWPPGSLAPAASWPSGARPKSRGQDGSGCGTSSSSADASYVDAGGPA